MKVIRLKVIRLANTHCALVKRPSDLHIFALVDSATFVGVVLGTATISFSAKEEHKSFCVFANITLAAVVA